MDRDELRIKIYEYLGLEIGSLASEGGNDWVRAEKEVLEDYKRDQLEKKSKDKSIDYAKIEKSSEEFQYALTTENVCFDNYKITISSRDDLDENDVILLINTGSKDVLINIARAHKLSARVIDILIPKSVYLVKKSLIQMQKLSKDQKKLLRPFMETVIEASNDYWESDDL